MRRLLEAGAARASLSTVFQQLLRLTQPYCPIATGARVFRQDGSLLTISIAGGAVRAISRLLLLFKASNAAQLLTNAAEFEGTVFGAAIEFGTHRRQTGSLSGFHGGISTVKS